MLTPSQLRAARGFLDWSRKKCARVTGVSAETIRNIEQERYIPSPATLEKIANGFSGYGVEFFGMKGLAMKDGAPSSKGALQVERMAAAIADVLKAKGECAPSDLLERSFSSDDLDAHWRLAYALAQVRRSWAH